MTFRGAMENADKKLRFEACGNRNRPKMLIMKNNIFSNGGRDRSLAQKMPGHHLPKPSSAAAARKAIFAKAVKQKLPARENSRAGSFCLTGANSLTVGFSFSFSRAGKRPEKKSLNPEKEAQPVSPEFGKHTACFPASTGGWDYLLGRRNDRFS